MSYRTTTYRFEEVRRQVSKRLSCRACGKRFARSKTFTQTINPFNKNAAGQVKTFPEIWKELGETCDAWQPPDLCGKCSDGAA